MLTFLIKAILKRQAVPAALVILCTPAIAQQASFSLLPAPSIEPNAMVRSAEPVILPEAPSHRFWDRENSFLFAANAAFSTADFIVTRNNLRNGGQELNPVTRVFAGSTAGLAVNFAGETAGVVALSYVFHKTGHHKLERAISVLNLGSSATAVTFDVMRR
jgi:hypothetical protein